MSSANENSSYNQATKLDDSLLSAVSGGFGNLGNGQSDDDGRTHLYDMTVLVGSVTTKNNKNK